MKTGQLARQHWSLIAGIAFAAALQLVLVARSPIIAKDGIVYINTAKALAADPLHVIRTEDTLPGYPALIVLGQRFVATLGVKGLASWIAGGRLITGLSGLLLVAFLWFLTRLAFDTRTAAVAIFIVAMLPLFRENAADVLRDTPHLGAYLLSTWFLIKGLRSERPASLWLIVSSAMSGLAYWLRAEGLSVCVASILLVIVSGARIPETTARRLLARLAAVTLPAGALVAPRLILKGTVDTRGVLASMGTSAWTHGLAANPVSLLTSLVGDLAGDFAHGLRYVLVPLLILGLAGRRYGARADKTVGRVILLLVVLHTALLSYFYLVHGFTQQRFMMVTVALSIPWAAAGAVRLAQLPKSAHWNHPRIESLRLHPNRLLVFLVLAFVLGMMPRALRTLHNQRREVVAAALWLKQQARKEDCVLTNSRYVPFYSELRGVIIPPVSPVDCLDNSLAFECRFAVLDTGASDYAPRWLAPLARTGRRLDTPATEVEVWELAGRMPGQ